MLKVDIKLKPFPVPVSVHENVEIPQPLPVGYQSSHASQSTCNEHYIAGREFHLSELDTETLESMCDEFRNEIFKRAGKDVPNVAVERVNVPDEILRTAKRIAPNLDLSNIDDMGDIVDFVLSLNE